MIEYPKKILLATDAAEDSVKAARVAAALAASSGAGLHMVHVGRAATSNVSAAASRPALPGEPPGYAARQAQKLLESQAEEISAEGGDLADAHLRMGQPAAEVVALAAELGADLLVVGSGGPHQMRRVVAATTRRLAMGLAADAIVRTAPCPVLVVRGDVAFGAALTQGDRGGNEL